MSGATGTTPASLTPYHLGSIQLDPVLREEAMSRRKLL